LKAWQVNSIGSPKDVICLEEKAVPEPGPGEALIKVAAAGVGLPDVLMCQGQYVYSPTKPFTPGQEVVGVAVAVGEGSSVEVGQRVMGVTAFYNGHGGFAEFCIVPDFSLYPTIDSMSDAEAAGFCIPYHTAWVGLVLRAQIKRGEILLVHGGSGGTGSAGIQLGKALGAEIIATAGSAEKLEYCQALGADYSINHRDENFVEQVMNITDNRGADVVYDPVGGDIFERSVDCAAPGGRLLAVGFASGRWGLADSAKLVMRNCSAIGVFVGAHSHEELLVGHLQLLDLYSQGKISAPATEVESFESLAECLDRLERRQVQGKAVLSLN
jgi:NADPH2:quinone reductase